MIRLLLYLDVVFTFTLGAFSLFKKEDVSILFIGNSYTYRNHMPRMVKELALAKGKNIYVEQSTKGKANLSIQAKREEVFEIIRSRKWDYVIIQGSSRDMLRDSTFIAQKTIPAIQTLMDSIHANNPASKKLFFMTWGYRNGFKPIRESNSYNKMTMKVKEGYLMLKEQFHTGVVPVGMAWYNLRKSSSDVVLYVKDGAHPSAKGSYLTACCFYSALFKESTFGADYYGNLDSRTCRLLQSIASKTVLGHMDKYGLE